MEATATKKKTRSKADQASKIKKAFIEYVNENGKRPASIFKFVKAIKVSEEAFYEHFNSFENIEKSVWRDLFNETLDAIQSDKVFEEYSVREKLLAFYFTFVEKMKSKRSFLLLTVPKYPKPDFSNHYLMAIKDSFKEFANDLMLEAKETEEVTDRPVIGKRYHDGLWLQLLFIVDFWMKDDSIAFEKTDAAIEKSVNLAFDLMGKGPLDAMLDFGKFVYQNRR